MNENGNFQKIKEAAKATGLSTYYIREGCKAGQIPHIRCGLAYLVNVPALLEKLDRESRRGMAGEEVV